MRDLYGCGIGFAVRLPYLAALRSSFCLVGWVGRVCEDLLGGGCGELRALRPDGRAVDRDVEHFFEGFDVAAGCSRQVRK